MTDCTTILDQEVKVRGQFRHWVLTRLSSAAETACPVDVVDVGGVLAQECLELAARIDHQLASDSGKAAGTESMAPTSSAIGTCRAFVQRLAPHIALAPQLKVGAFVEDEGGISLVLQSLVTDRRLNYRIPPQGDHVTVIQIDERMQAKSMSLSVDDRAAIRELAKWVTTRV